MIIIDPYETKYGKLIKIDSIKTTVAKYMLTNDDDISYGYTTNSDVGFVCITGYNPSEQEIPIFDHPLIVTDIKNRKYVVVDIRKYVRQHSKYTPLSEIIKDKSSVDFIILRGLLTASYVSGNMGILRNVYKECIASHAIFLTYIINIIVGLNIAEKINVEIAISAYLNTLTVNDDDAQSIKSVVVPRLYNGIYSMAVAKKEIEKVVDRFDYNPADMDGLIYNITSVMSDGKKEFIDSNVIYQLLNNTWYGPAGTEAIYVSLEHIPTLIALVYTSYTDMTYKKSRYSSLLQNYKTKIKPDNMIKSVNKLLEEINKK